MYLARIGLVSKNEIAILRKAMSLKSKNKPLPYTYRDILLKVLDKMIGMVTGKTQMFNRARQAVKEEKEYQYEEVLDTWIFTLADLMELDEDNPCWKGYKKVPGKKDYEDGSCVKEDEEDLEEAGYLDPPKTKAEVDKKFPDTEEDVKNKNSKDLQSIKFK